MYYVDITVRPEDMEGIVAVIEDAARSALDATAQVVAAQVREFTPVWTGEFSASIQPEMEDGGDTQVVASTDELLSSVFENNGSWGKMPPDAPIRQWVEGKLGLTGRAADRATWGIRRKILHNGLTLPNIEGKGQMFARTFKQMEATNFHMQTFTAMLQASLGG